MLNSIDIENLFLYNFFLLYFELFVLKEGSTFETKKPYLKLIVHLIFSQIVKIIQNPF